MLERLQVHFINQPPTHRPHHISSPQLRLVNQYDIRERRSQQHPAQLLRLALQTSTRSRSLQQLRPSYPPNRRNLIPTLRNLDMNPHCREPL